MTNDKLKPYVERLEQMYHDRHDITDDEKDLLAWVRNSLDRREASYTRLVRTFYGECSDTIFADLISQAEFDGPVFDNAALYDAGWDDNLQSLQDILTRTPQTVEETACFALIYDDRMRGALEEAMEIGQDEVDYIIAMSHQVVNWNHVLIYDKEANDSQGTVLLEYIDDRGWILRYSRVDGAEDLQAADAMLCSGQDIQHRWWEDGRYGEDWEPQQLFKRWAEVAHEPSEDGASESNLRGVVYICN